MFKLLFTVKYPLAALALVLSASGCATWLSSTPEERVMHRAQQRWDALKAQDFKVAYTFMSPLQKATTPEAEYVRLMAGGNAWLDARVVGVTCSQQICHPSVRIQAASPLPLKFGDNITTHVDEDWVLVDGEWWFKQK